MFHYVLILKQTILIGVLLSGFAGAILFFPLRLNRHSTCLYHQWSHQPTIITHNSNAVGIHGKAATSLALPHDHLLKHYLHAYAFLWWISLALFTTGIYGLRHLRYHNKSTKQSNSEHKL